MRPVFLRVIPFCFIVFLISQLAMAYDFSEKVVRNEFGVFPPSTTALICKNLETLRQELLVLCQEGFAEFEELRRAHLERFVTGAIESDALLEESRDNAFERLEASEQLSVDSIRNEVDTNRQRVLEAAGADRDGNPFGLEETRFGVDLLAQALPEIRPVQGGAADADFQDNANDDDVLEGLQEALPEALEDNPYFPVPTVSYTMGSRQVRRIVLGDAKELLHPDVLAKPWIVIFFPTDEERARAFPVNPQEVIDVAAINHNVLFSRVSGTRDAAHFLRILVDLYQRPAALKVHHAILGGHGTAKHDELYFSRTGVLTLDPDLVGPDLAGDGGGGASRNHYLTVDFFKILAPLMTPGFSKLLYLSCRAGGGENSLGLRTARFMRGIRVLAPVEDVREGSVQFLNIDRFEILPHESTFLEFVFPVR